MRTIHKVQFQFQGGVQTKRLNVGAKFLTFAIQRGVMTAWFEVNRDTPMQDRFFRIIGTGHDVPALACYLGTLIDEPYVWHLYGEN